MENSLPGPDIDDLLSADLILAGLRTRYVGRPVYYWPAIGSTNDELKHLAEAGAPEGTLAVADQQTAGRGRLDRRWMAPAGSSLLASLLFRPTFLEPDRGGQLTMICSLAMADAVAQVTGVQPALKWPNDLLLDGKKLAGILTELGFSAGSPSAEADTIAWAIVGVGLNVNQDFDSAASRRAWPWLAEGAVSLAMASGKRVSRLRLLHSYLSQVEVRYDALRAGHSPHQEWASRLVTLGEQVVVDAPDGVYRGLAETVDETGALMVRQPGGRLRRVIAGDVGLEA
jgi:BirA family biotin operon repressor/biotin-[acetyl-CoA-carboxylase] ligase